MQGELGYAFSLGEEIMTTLAQSVGEIRKPWKWIVAGGAVLLIWGAVAFPRLNRSKMADLDQIERSTMPAAERYVAPQSADHSAALYQDSAAMKAEAIAGALPPSAPVERKIIRTSALEMIVQHPADVANQIAG